MSQYNVERVLAGYEAINRGDLDAAVAGLSPDFELSPPPILPDARVYRGPDEFRQFWQTWIESFDDFRIDIEEVIDAGDRVVLMAAVSGKGKDSGVETRTPSFPHVWTFRGNEIIRMEALQNRAAAVEALGLEE